MPNFLFASNNVSHFPAAQIHTDQNMYDSNRVPYGISFDNGTIQASCLPFPRTTTNETWIHFRYGVGTTTYNINGDLFFMRDSSTQTDVLRIQKTNNTLPFGNLIINDGVSTQSASIQAPLSSNVNISIDIRFELSLSEMKATMYINSTQVALVSLQVNQGKVLHPDIIRLCGSGRYSTHYPTFSEIIVADGDTRNMRLNMLRPTLPGAYNDWEGSILSLVDDDTTSGILSSTPGDKISYSLNEYTGSSVISGVVSVSTGSHGLNGPANLKHFLRKSAVDYKSLDQPVGDSLSTQVVNWTINPATSLPWTIDDLSDIEFGLESVA